MGIFSLPASSAGKTPRIVTLTSGTSWTVPDNVTFVNATLYGGGGGGARQTATTVGTIASNGFPGEMVTTSVTTTPGASIAYSIGAGGSGGSAGIPSGGTGGTTTFTGATSALGGAGGISGSTGATGTVATGNFNGGQGGQPSTTGGASGGSGGAGKIVLEYWI